MFVCGKRCKVIATKEVSIEGNSFVKIAVVSDSADTYTIYKPLNFCEEHCVLPDGFVWVARASDGRPVLTAVE